MHEHRCHRHGHLAGEHASSSRVSVPHLSVKPNGSWSVSSTFATFYRTTGFTKTGLRPRGATS